MKVTSCSENTTDIKVTQEYGECELTVKLKEKRIDVNVVLWNLPDTTQCWHAKTGGANDKSLELRD
jgi:hypothetical protein